MMNVDKALELVKKEIESAVKDHGVFNSPHEGYAVIKEEKEEFFEAIDANLERIWKAVKMNVKKYPEQTEIFLKEGVQFAAMIIRFIADFC